MFRKRITLALAAISFCGCSHSRQLPNAGHGDLIDNVFGRRHTHHLPEEIKSGSLYCLAGEVTEIEDTIRRDGTITIKKPDVWGDGALTHFIQEYDRQMAASVGDFEATLQAYIARSDQMEVTSATSLGIAASNANIGTVAPAGTISAGVSGSNGPTLSLPTAGLLDLKDAEFERLVTTINSLTEATKGKKGIGVEPTELERQKSTYINVNQSLRRRNIGSDTAQSAGYGLYKFRVPVSVLPGRETHEGYSALVSMRARPKVDEASLHNAFSRLIINDLVDRIAPAILETWNDEKPRREADQARIVGIINQHIATLKSLSKQIKDAPEYNDYIQKLEKLTAAFSSLDKCLADQTVMAEFFDVHDSGNLMAQSLHRAAVSLDEKSRACTVSSIEAEIRSLGLKILLINHVNRNAVFQQYQEWKQLARTNAVNGKALTSISPVAFSTPVVIQAEDASEESLNARLDVSLLEKTAQLLQANSSLSPTDLKGPRSQLYSSPEPIRDVLVGSDSYLESYVDSTPIGAASLTAGTVQTGKFADLQNVYDIDVVRRILKDRYQASRIDVNVPKYHELREYLRGYLIQVHEAMKEGDLYSQQAHMISRYAKEVAGGELLQAKNSQELERENWFQILSEQQYQRDFIAASWLIASQAGITDVNMKRILQDLQRQGEISEADFGMCEANTFFFFAPQIDRDTTLRMWRTIIEKNFPIHVFALDPQVEEQNAFDAFNRRRELQLALAISVASGQIGLDQRLAASRRLGLDLATIELNRTVVGFAHGNDTFGWYFRPRVQTPPTESSNIAALARTIWATGPTEHYDLRHRELEPGMRECEAIIVMPRFLSQVEFDVTTNWEKLACPGTTKRSYEEMIALGARVHSLQTQLCAVTDNECFRPGDYERLLSRVEQLEDMLALQTYTCTVPFDPEVSGVELFDTGNAQLKPELYDFYGLDYVSTKEGVTANVFFSGNNFHPTLTHVITGGSDSNTTQSPPKVDVINRRLIKVTISNLNDALSKKGMYRVRVATPAGLSNELTLVSKPPESTPQAGWKHDGPALVATLCDDCTRKSLHFAGISPKRINFRYADGTPPPAPANDAYLIIQLSATDTAGKAIKIVGENASNALPFDANSGIELAIVQAEIANMINSNAVSFELKPGTTQFKLSATLYVKQTHWPVAKVLNTLDTTVTVQTTCAAPCGTSIPTESVPTPAADSELPAAQ